MKVLHRKMMFPAPLRTYPGYTPDRVTEPSGSPKSSYSNENEKSSPPAPDRQMTQQDQDEQDDQKRREALRDLVESWMERLQLISVITTFFASTEAGLLSLTAPREGIPSRVISQIASVGIIGALVVHASAAIISFLAAFFLIRYKLKVASNEEREAEREREKQRQIDNDHAKAKVMVESPTDIDAHHNHASRDQEKGVNRAYPTRWQHTSRSAGPILEHDTDPVPGAVRVPTGSPGARRMVWSSNPHIIQVGPFQNHPPTHLLHRCHTLCVILTTTGFAMALMGILCYAWDKLPHSVSISATVCMGMCVLSGILVIVKPYPPEGTSSQIYVLDEL